MPPVLVNPSRFGSTAPPATGYAAEVLADSPLAFYKLNEASGTVAADSSGNARNATINGSPAGYAAGGPAGVGNAMSFDSDSYVAISSASWMDVGTAGTIETWFRTGAAGGDLSLAGRSSASGYFFADYLSDGTMRFYLTTSGGTTICSASVPGLRNDVWRHVVGTYDGTNMRLYVDKVLKQTTPKTGSVLTTVGALAVGRRTSSDLTTAVPHRAAAFALYGSTLSATRIAAHYDAGITA